MTAPSKFGKILGEALRWAGPDKITWGTDYAGFAAQIRGAAMGFRNFQIPEDLQMQYGYPPITDEDKRKIFGGNLGRLLGIDTIEKDVFLTGHLKKSRSCLKVCCVYPCRHSNGHGGRKTYLL